MQYAQGRRRMLASPGHQGPFYKKLYLTAVYILRI